MSRPPRQNNMEPSNQKTETVMSKADELELRRYFIKALVWVSGVAVSVIISVGGVLYKKMEERVSAMEEYRISHEEKGRTQLVEYSSRLVKLETDVQAIQEWRKEMQESLRVNQQEILKAIREIK